MTKKIYFCTECKKRLIDLEEILFIEDDSPRGFCSEKCILSFYRPYMKVFQEQEQELRAIFSLEVEENILTVNEEESSTQTALYSPHEVWQDSSELQEIYYTHILQLDFNGPVFFILICSYFESNPSFMFHKVITRSEKLVENYRVGEKIEISNQEELGSDQEVELPAELIEQMELKKSQLLAQLLAARESSDIDFEEFIDYEKFLTSTLEAPDEVYEKHDDEGEVMATFIKSFKEDLFCFYYVAICWKCSVDGIKDQVLVPILSFPSTDHELYQDYAVGDKTLGQVKN